MLIGSANTLALLAPGMMTDAVGLVLLGAVVARQYATVSEELPVASAIGR